MTSIIYGLTLGCVIFLVVSLNLVIRSMNTTSIAPGCDLVVISSDYSYFWAYQVDDVLYEYKDSIKEFGYLARTNAD